jgi:methionyl aminopeptidase
MMTRPKTADEVAAMRESGKMLATVLQKLTSSIAVGQSSKDLAEIARAELKSLGGEPTFLGYYGFPDVLCVSINDAVVHGIPSESEIIKDGDIVSMDFGVTYKGMITDSAISVIVGNPDPKDVDLLATTKKSLHNAIGVVKAGVHVGTISHAAETVLKKGKYGIVRDFVGHGVGHLLHEEPNIPNYGKAGTGPVLHANMTVAIEPMATRGADDVYIANDGWKVLTRDGSRAAHFEHTVLITEKGAEIITTI